LRFAIQFVSAVKIMRINAYIIVAITPEVSSAHVAEKTHNSCEQNETKSSVLSKSESIRLVLKSDDSLD